MFCFNEPSSDQFLKTQHWYIQQVRTLWDLILFTDHFAIKAHVEYVLTDLHNLKYNQ